MKQIQKGFTLIELMIVVAIIGILAAVAIPAYQDYIVKSKLSKVTTTLDPVKTAIAMYFQEQGGFPSEAGNAANAAGVAANVGKAPAAGTAWASLGFSIFPSVPNEVKTMVYDAPAGCVSGSSNTCMGLVLELQNVKAGSIDGTWLSVSPNVTASNAGPIPTSNAASGATGSVLGSSALQWYYGCAQGMATVAVDNVMKRYFVNPGNIPPC